MKIYNSTENCFLFDEYGLVRKFFTYRALQRGKQWNSFSKINTSKCKTNDYLYNYVLEIAMQLLISETGIMQKKTLFY